MKKGILIGVCLFFIASIAYAADFLWGSNVEYTSTKAAMEVSVSPAEPIQVMTPYSTCTVYLNDTTGTGLKMVADTWYPIRVPSNITKAVFDCRTTATAKKIVVIK
jgi:hypothetical protein